MKQVLVFGRRKQGKSTLTLMLALAHRERVLIFDPNLQFDAIGHHVNSVEQVHRAIIDGREAVIVYSPATDDQVGAFEAWADLLWKHWRNLRMAVLIDESSLLQRASGANRKLERFVRQSPDSMMVLQSTHRISDTVVVARQLATDAYFFFTSNKLDLDRIRTDYDELGEEIVEAVANLNTHQVCHVWMVDGGFLRFSIWEPESFYVRINSRENSREEESRAA